MKSLTRSRAGRATWFVRAAALVAVAASVTGIGACGLSREDAEEWCNQLRDNDPFGTTCITDEAFDECVSCSLECGKCRKLNTCPQSFECFE